MKKMLLCIALVSALILTGCNNNKGKNENDNINQNQNQVQNQEQKENNDLIESYEKPDFSEEAGFKVNVEEAIKGVKYDSIFLMNDSTAQLDLKLPDGSIGTLLVKLDVGGIIEDAQDAVFIDDTKVTINKDLDKIITYKWSKDGYEYTYSTKTDIKESEVLRNLVNKTIIEEKK